MTFPKYPEYKDSGVEWLGEVPVHWDVSPFKWQIEANDGGAWGEDPAGDDDTYVLRSTDQTVDGRWKITEPALRRLNPKERASTILKAGDLVVTKSSGSSLHIGKTTLVDKYIAAKGFSFGNFMQRIRTKSTFCPRLAWYFMNNGVARLQLDLLSNSTTGLANLNGTIIGAVQVTTPPREEQADIVAFLDHETARIDALVEQQQRLIELLKEKRQAVISHAVTQGLDPDVPMKDSGVEWLGEVPVHWEVKRLKHISFSIKAGPFGSALTKDMYQSEGYRVYGQEQVIPGDFSIGDYHISTAVFSSLSQYEVKEGDILISCVGTFGKIAIVPRDAAPGIMNPRLIRLRVGGAADPAYLEVVLKSQPIFEQFSVLSRGGTMDVINVGTLSEIDLPVPSRGEQEKILEHVVAEKARIDSLVSQAKTASILLKERRSALISAAVTGKIDVRGWQSPAGSSASIEATQTEAV